ncbi:MAG: hypothetical protein RR133_06625 [Kiritimatiellia bacterium]
MNTTLYLSRTTCTAVEASFFLDKAIKCSSLSLGKLPSAIGLPHNLSPLTMYRLQTIAALSAIPIEICSVPESDDPFVFWLNEHQQTSKLPQGLTDWHAHTQFAYCSRGIDLCSAIELSQTWGVETQCFSEHAFALYFPSNALKFYWQSDRAFVERIWETSLRGRMKLYRDLIAPLRIQYGKRIQFGLEVDLFANGNFCLAQEDQDGWDYLIGAIHEVEGIDPRTASNAELEKAWFRDVERLTTFPISILAHPFRYFPWYHREVPRHLYRSVARLLAQRKIAAEINHHQNPFELEFFRICLEEGVRLSLGTDAHITRNIADLHPHLQTLTDLGLTARSSSLLNA